MNRNSVPARAMTLDAMMNIFLLTYFASAIEILAAGNLGYILAHVFALTGFLLLRRDRPNWPRPIRLSAIWVPIAGLLAIANSVFIVVGGFIYSGGFLGIETQYGYGWDKTRIGLIVLAVSLLLYAYRHVVQDKTGIRLREETPTMPEEPVGQPAPAAPRLGRRYSARRSQLGRSAIACRYRARCTGRISRNQAISPIGSRRKTLNALPVAMKKTATAETNSA